MEGEGVMKASGPLAGVRVLELAGIGPAPFCGMLLADLGADVLRIERPEVADLGIEIERRFDLLNRGKRSLGIDLKKPEGVAFVLKLTARADALIEGFRPGVTERLGLGPDVCLGRNPNLVYGRMTGWGQQGPLAAAAGHDINYIALTGALHAIGPKGQPPFPPLNLVGDFGGGALYLAVGVVAALLAARAGKGGQVVDAAMVDGASHLMTLFYGLHQMGSWKDARGVNVLDGGAYYYGVYATADNKFVAVGAVEKRFQRDLLTKLEVDGTGLTEDRLREIIARRFQTKTRDEWRSLLEGTDVCFAPVLSLTEAPGHPHNQRRNVFVEVDGVTQPAPAPRFSRTPGTIRSGPPEIGAGGVQAISEWLGSEAVNRLDGLAEQKIAFTQ
jgi:alpha-methylacyl-CoA racemase